MPVQKKLYGFGHLEMEEKRIEEKRRDAGRKKTACSAPRIPVLPDRTFSL